MPRNISFALTTQQFRDRTKTVTRRMGWRNAKAGDVLCGVVKGMGLKKGEKVERLGEIRIINIRREVLKDMITHIAYGEAEVIAEGFPTYTPFQFVGFFAASHKCKTDDVVTRIEFEYL